MGYKPAIGGNRKAERFPFYTPSFFWIVGRRGRADKLALRRQRLRMSRAEPTRDNMILGREFAFRYMGQRVA